MKQTAYYLFSLFATQKKLQKVGQNLSTKAEETLKETVTSDLFELYLRNTK